MAHHELTPNEMKQGGDRLYKGARQSVAFGSVTFTVGLIAVIVGEGFGIDFVAWKLQRFLYLQLVIGGIFLLIGLPGLKRYKAFKNSPELPRATATPKADPEPKAASSRKAGSSD